LSVTISFPFLDARNCPVDTNVPWCSLRRRLILAKSRITGLGSGTITCSQMGGKSRAAAKRTPPWKSGARQRRERGGGVPECRGEPVLFLVQFGGYIIRSTGDGPVCWGNGALWRSTPAGQLVRIHLAWADIVETAKDNFQIHWKSGLLGLTQSSNASSLTIQSGKISAALLPLQAPRLIV
jgi:hypothetical protein